MKVAEGLSFGAAGMPDLNSGRQAHPVVPREVTRKIVQGPFASRKVLGTGGGGTPVTQRTAPVNCQPSRIRPFLR